MEIGLRDNCAQRLIWDTLYRLLGVQQVLNDLLNSSRYPESYSTDKTTRMCIIVSKRIFYPDEMMMNKNFMVHLLNRAFEEGVLSLRCLNVNLAFSSALGRITRKAWDPPLNISHTIRFWPESSHFHLTWKYVFAGRR